jgi:hypothetical protein
MGDHGEMTLSCCSLRCNTHQCKHESTFDTLQNILIWSAFNTEHRWGWKTIRACIFLPNLNYIETHNFQYYLLRLHRFQNILLSPDFKEHLLRMRLTKALYIVAAFTLGVQALPTPGEADKAWSTNTHNEADEAWKISKFFLSS